MESDAPFLKDLAKVLPSKGRVLIIPHDYPDPDALASAAAVELLLNKHFHLKGQIVFTGVVSRAENREMLKHFRYKWRLLNQIAMPSRKYPCIFVDTTPWSGNVTIPSFVKPIAVFDHHPHPARVKKKEAEGMYADIRTGVGAAVSMLYQYLEAATIAIPSWLATVMLYAISTETLDLSRGYQDLDFTAYTGLLKKANMQVLGRIRNAPLPRSYYAFLREAMENAMAYGRVAWSHLDHVSQPEFVAETADLLLRAERITWSFCTAWHKDQLLVSIRSSQRGAKCGQLIKRVIRKGEGAAGGHHSMAAGYMDLTGRSPEEREARRLELVRSLLRRIEKRLSSHNEPIEAISRKLVEVKTES